MAEPPRRIATHEEPIWRDRSTFVIAIDLPDHGGKLWHPRDEVVDRLVGAGALAEWSSKNFVAIDCVDQDHASAVAGILAELEQQQALEFEAGRS